MASSKDYWQVRLQDNIYKKNVKELENKLLSNYKRAEKTIQGQLINLYSSMLEKGEISANMMYSENRYKALQDIINQEVIKLGKTEEKEVAKTLLKSYKQVYEQTNKVYGVKATWTILDENTAKETVFANFKGANFSERIWTNKSALREQIEKSVIDSVVAGNSKDRAVKEVRSRFGKGFNDADRIVRTETQRVLNDGQRQSYKSNGYTKVNWLVADDERLCDECMGYELNNPYDIDNVPSIVHPNCRCTFIPVLDESLFK